MTAVLFTRRGFDYTVTFNYTPVLVNVIKTTVPHYARSWNQVAKQWTVEAQWAPVLAAEIRRLGHDVIGLDPPEKRRDRDDDPSHWARVLFKRVGPARAPLAYRLMSRVCHPDHGGDHHLQVELNQAYAAITQRKESA